MRLRFAQRLAAVVAGGAVARNAAVVPAHREEGEGAPVAALARGGGFDVRWGLGACMRAVVAVGTGPDNLVVIKAYLHPGRGRMAGLAVGCGRSMRAALPGGNAAVVATDALPGRAFEAAIDVAGR